MKKFLVVVLMVVFLGAVLVQPTQAGPVGRRNTAIAILGGLLGLSLLRTAPSASYWGPAVDCSRNGYSYSSRHGRRYGYSYSSRYGRRYGHDGDPYEQGARDGYREGFCRGQDDRYRDGQRAGQGRGYEDGRRQYGGDQHRW